MYPPSPPWAPSKPWRSRSRPPRRSPLPARSRARKSSVGIRYGRSTTAPDSSSCAAMPPVRPRLRILDDGKLSFALTTPWAHGTTHLVLWPHELIEKLAALEPLPRVNLIRYHGILGAQCPRPGSDRAAEDGGRATRRGDASLLPHRQTGLRGRCSLARVFRRRHPRRSPRHGHRRHPSWASSPESTAWDTRVCGQRGTPASARYWQRRCRGPTPLPKRIEALCDPRHPARPYTIPHRPPRRRRFTRHPAFRRDDGASYCL